MDILKLVKLTLCSLVIGTAQAETELYIKAISKHYVKGDYNESHDMLIVKHDGTLIGCYENSYSDTSCLVGKQWGNWKLMLVTGYSKPVILAPAYVIDYKFLEFGIIPGAIVTSVKLPLGKR